ncbi:Cysteine-rich membrane protein 2 [Spironucleus salmonicida]|uniref:Cysteine-rich membrane protein 2 n=1 Tax=Spironucleus salmonicida TaxID=348837 RepID=V6LBN7_9EUKA|nr:Cysteine-rich membrane protein 2 [Spironucleus salmonicida]|eukprot:EST41842.1 Cysteine-rich membrane protein 2 [Spironucleus salmonicida]
MNICKTDKNCIEPAGAQSFCIDQSCTCPQGYNRENYQNGRICRKYFCKKNADCNDSGTCVECNESLNNKTCLDQFGSTFANGCICKNGFYGALCGKCDGYVFEDNSKHCLTCPASCINGPCGIDQSGQIYCLEQCNGDENKDCFCPKYTFKQEQYEGGFSCIKGGCDGLHGKCNGQGKCTDEKYQNCDCRGNNFISYEKMCVRCYNDSQDPDNYCECRPGWRAGVNGNCLKAECGNIGDCNNGYVCQVVGDEYKCVNDEHLKYGILLGAGAGVLVTAGLLIYFIRNSTFGYKRVTGE